MAEEKKEIIGMDLGNGPDTSVETLAVISKGELKEIIAINYRRKANNDMLKQIEDQRAELMKEDEAWWNEIRAKYNIPIAKEPNLSLRHDTREITKLQK